MSNTNSKKWRCSKCGGPLRASLRGVTGHYINDDTVPLDIVFTCTSCFIGCHSRYKISILPEQMEQHHASE